MSKLIEVKTVSGDDSGNSETFIKIEDLLKDGLPMGKLAEFLYVFFSEEEPGARVTIDSYNAISTTTYTLL